MIDIDVNQLESLNSHGLFFGYNKKRIFSLFDSDYLESSALPVSEKIYTILQQKSLHPGIDSIRLVSIPRFIFKSFRPVNFYLCYSKQKELISLLAEVSNTYHETSYYLMDNPVSCKKGYRFSIDKNFHVSPFFEEEGYYEFEVSDNVSDFKITISYLVNDKPSFYADFSGKKRPLTSWQAIKTAVRYPLTLLLVFPRILYQATKLYWIKRLPARPKPIPSNETLLHPMPLSRLEKKIITHIKKGFHNLNHGKLTLLLPDLTSLSFGNSDKDPQAKIVISNTWFFKSVWSGGDIGLGESYMRGEWNSDHVEKVIAFMIINRSCIQSYFRGSFFTAIFNKIKHQLRKNTLGKSKQNIAAHYDLGNTFYQLFLDPTMMYSSGIFLDESNTLEVAQHQKVKRLVSALNLNSASHVLEIGSGWGYAAIYIAKTYGCRVTSITLSKEQKLHADALVNKENLSHLITIKLSDYRSMSGQFDAILSIEMIEAVGHEYLPIFFQTCDRLLTQGGRFSLQSITYPNNEYDQYRKKSDFIRKHIFPGGHLPSLAIMEKITTKKTQLKEVSSLNIAQSYANTLAKWRSNFIAKKEELMMLGFDITFYRKWIFYFAYCEAAFRTNYLGCYQLVYEKGSVNSKNSSVIPSLEAVNND